MAVRRTSPKAGSGASEAMAPKGPSPSGAERPWAANFQKPFFVFQKQPDVAKPLKIIEQSYTFLKIVPKTAFSKSPRMFWKFVFFYNFWQPLAGPDSP